MESSELNLELVDDVLLKILCFSDLLSVLALSLASRRLHGLAQEREVWLSLATDLKQRGFADLEPSVALKDLCSSELVDLVKRVVTGPQSWTGLDRETRPLEPYRRVSLLSTAPVEGLWRSRYLLLPGGQYLLGLYGDGRALHCTHVATNQVIWTYESSLEHGKAVAFTAALCHNSSGMQTNIATIVIGVRTFPRRSNNVEILNLNLDTGVSTSLHIVPCQNTTWDNPFDRIRLKSDFALAITSTDTHDFMPVTIIQVSTGRYSVVPFKRRTEIDFMVPGHLVTLAYLPGQSALSLEIRDAYSIVNSQTLPPPIISQRLDTSFLSQPHYTNYRFSIHASPILPNSSRLWVALSSPPDMARGGVSVGQGHDKMFFRYNVQYGEDGAISIHPCYNVVPNELVALPPPPHDTPISFAGTMIIDNDRHPREAHLYTISSQGITHRQLDAGDHGSCLHFSDYGGVLLHRSRKDKSVSIDYYK